ncbi:MAG TPA: hypothetical protein H9895_10940 [Candidatus Pseudogracilibacillus intestinigallinarum]|uniref:YbbR domain-containing protein n=1 Tax=Candidatus Pseudogracilibacillus intestinigallinarum TaxID=2838742 RepID=A0A9D1TKV1_9BACI|nr:hypothetical protein [Candidatus Pseudogracilibacillus intestinigallinarum]
MDKLFQSKWFIRVISLVLAITLYLFVTVETNPGQNESRIETTSSKETEVIDEVPLEIKIDAENYVVSGVPEHVKVSLEGKTSVLTPIVRQQSFTVFVDLRELEEGSHTVEVEYDNIPKEVNAYIEPKTIDVQIEKRAMQEFSVDVDITNLDKLPVGYELGEPSVDPETVTIVSSQEVIDQIAMVKVFVDVTDLRESIRNKELPIIVYDAQGNDLNVRVEPSSVTVSMDVDRPSTKVPLDVKTKGKLPDKFEIDKMEAVEEIEIFGRRDVLDEVKEISTEEIDLSEIESSGAIEVPLNLPEGIAVNDEKIKVDITLKESKVFKEIPIEIKGEGDQKVVFKHPEDGTISVTAIGLDTLMEELEESEIIASIDVTNTDSDKESRVNISIEGPKDFKFDAEPKKVTVEVNE